MAKLCRGILWTQGICTDVVDKLGLLSERGSWIFLPKSLAEV